MRQELAKTYDPHAIEERWGDWWVGRNLFRADPASQRPMFSLVIPPPNVTGSLHMGHMLEHTEIDILIRWKRMNGFNTLWLPGTDHAGIATQVMVERRLAEEGLDRKQLGREEFERRVWQWKEEHGDTINPPDAPPGGGPGDWSRERFTLDPGLSRAVREVFVRLYGKEADLPQPLHDQLVPALPDGAVRPGGHSRRAARQPVAHPLSGPRHRRARGGGHHASRDHAGRHRCRPCIPTTRATGSSTARPSCCR